MSDGDALRGTQFYYVLIEISHGMGEFRSTRAYTGAEADELVTSMRADGINCYRKKAYFEVAGFVPHRIFNS